MKKGMKQRHEREREGGRKKGEKEEVFLGGMKGGREGGTKVPSFIFSFT